MSSTAAVLKKFIEEKKRKEIRKAAERKVEVEDERGIRVVAILFVSKPQMATAMTDLRLYATGY